MADEDRIFDHIQAAARSLGAVVKQPMPPRDGRGSEGVTEPRPLGSGCIGVTEPLEPRQIMATGHGAAPARLRNVKIGAGYGG